MLAAVSIKVGTTREDFYVTTPDLAFVLGVSAAELAELHRSSILKRTRAKTGKGTPALYPVFDSIKRYCAYQKGKRQAVHHEFLEAKAGRERATQFKVEMANRVASGELVSKRQMIERLTPIVVAFREQLLSRSERLAREIMRTKSPKEKVERIRQADRDALSILNDLFKVAGNGKAKRGA
jgi:hypothetical protein